MAALTLVAAGFLYASVLLAVALARAGRLHFDARPLVVAVAAYAALALVVRPFLIPESPRPTPDEWGTHALLTLVAYAGLAALIVHLIRSCRRRAAFGCEGAEADDDRPTPPDDDSDPLEV